jgi:hypothetical protein
MPDPPESESPKAETPRQIGGAFQKMEGGEWMMGGERLDISVRNAKSTAAP